MKSKVEGMLDPDLLQQFAIVDKDGDFDKALQNGGGKAISGSVISVKSSKSKVDKPSKQKESQKDGKKRGKDEHGSKSKLNKKHKS